MRKEYKAAEARIRESIKLQADGLPHTYPGRKQDLDTMREYHAVHGWPHLSLWDRLVTRARSWGGVR